MRKMSYKIKYKEWEALKDEIRELKKQRLSRNADLVHIRWLADRTVWHPGTRIKYILKQLTEMNVLKEDVEKKELNVGEKK